MYYHYFRMLNIRQIHYQTYYLAMAQNIKLFFLVPGENYNTIILYRMITYFCYLWLLCLWFPFIFYAVRHMICVSWFGTYYLLYTHEFV